MKTATEVFTQKDSLISPPGVEGAPTITQLEHNQANDYLYIVTFDHNIVVHKVSDLSLVKQVIKIIIHSLYLILLRLYIKYKLVRGIQ